MSLTCRVAVRPPTAEGVKITAIFPVPPFGLTVMGAVLVEKSEAFAPVNEKLVMVRGAVPEFVTVTTTGALGLPVAWLGKGTGFGLSAAIGRMPLPVSASPCGLFGALSAKFSVAVLLPVALGVKITPRFWTPPAATTSGDAGVGAVKPEGNEKSAAFAPVIEIPVI